MSKKKVSVSGSAGLSRRTFLVGMAASGGILTIVPRFVLGGSGYVPPSDRLNLAIIGTGGQGTEAAREAGVATQMGNQGHSGEGIRQTCEWIWDGAIGEIREVHAWSYVGGWVDGGKPVETPQLLPKTLAESYSPPPKSLLRSNGHHRDWLGVRQGAAVNLDRSFQPQKKA